MQRPYVPSQPAWLTALFNGMARRPSDLADPREMEFNQEDSVSALFETSRPERMYTSPRSESDALGLLVLDQAGARRPPMGPFGPSGFEQAGVSIPSIAGASSGLFDSLWADGPHAPNGTDALVQRILDDAANRRAPIALFDPIDTDRQPGHLFAVPSGSAERASGGPPMLSNRWNQAHESGDRMSTAEWMRQRNDQLRQPERLAAAASGERSQNRLRTTDTVDPLEYWSEYRAPAGRSAFGGDQKTLDLQAARAAGIEENPGAVEIENPGAIFNDVDEAARHIHPLMNRVSRSQNMEYQWAYYRDKVTGKIGYADPIAAGPAGGAGTNLNPFSNGRRFDPSFVDVTGTGHTHGDYSRRDSRTGKVVRTMRMYDEAGSDDYSQRQIGSRQSDYLYMRGTPRGWVHTLGTPSGRTWKWTHQGGRELIYERDP